MITDRLCIDLVLSRGDGYSRTSCYPEPSLEIEACRDKDDNKLLAVALSGETDCLITGDADLLALDPFEGLPILTPAAFLGATAAAEQPSRCI
jgi:hypothetical protein